MPRNGSTVVGVVMDAAERLDGGEVDDAAAVAVLDHRGQRRVGHPQDVLEIDREQVLPLLLGAVDERPARVHEVADVVDQHVEPAVALEHGVDHERTDAGVAHVRHQPRAARAARRPRPSRRARLQGGHGGVGAVAVDVDDQHRRPVVDERLADAPADAAGATGHDGDLAGQERHAYSGATERKSVKPDGAWAPTVACSNRTQPTASPPGPWIVALPTWSFMPKGRRATSSGSFMSTSKRSTQSRPFHWPW